MKYCIIGGGAFGTALALSISKRNIPVRLYVRNKTLYVKNGHLYISSDFSRKPVDEIEWSTDTISYIEYLQKYRRNYTLPGFILPHNIEIVAKYDAILDCENIIWSIPNESLYKAVMKFKEHLNAYESTINIIKREDRTFLSAVKGIISADRVIYPSRLLASTGIRTGILSGANIAKEVASNVLSTTIISGDCKIEERYGGIFSMTTHHIKESRMEIIELLGAMKNIVAIAVGIFDGLSGVHDIGDNSTATIYYMGINESIEIIKYFNRDVKMEDIFPPLMSSCGLGDLFVTCRSGRNYKEGVRIGSIYRRGEDFYCLLNEESERTCTLQGISTVKSIKDLIGPDFKNFSLFYRIYNILHENGNLAELIKILR